MRTQILGLGLSCLGCLCLHAFAAERPNLILVTGDDMGFQLGCYGDTVATTPHMDRLAGEGARFTRGYITQASCSSSRSSMLTGLYPHQNGQIGLAHLGYSMRPDVPTLPTRLKQAGYRTGIIGKLHVAPETSFDFDYKQTNTADTRDPKKVRAKCDAFLGELDGKPFFLMLNFFDPHDPHIRDIEGSPQAKVAPEQAKVYPFIGTDTPELRRRVAEFTTCVNRVDEGIGVLLDVLHQRGLDRNTLIVVLGDNGPPLPRAKVTSFEAGVNVPFIAWWPGQIKPQVSDALVCSIDLLPTFLELGQAAVPAGLPGRSLLPLLCGPGGEWRQWLATEYTTHEPRNLNPQRSIRDARYKLTVTLLKDPAFAWPSEVPLEEYRKIQKRAATGEYMELYDLQSDPDEVHNLAGSAEHRAVLDELRQAHREHVLTVRDVGFLSEAEMHRRAGDLSLYEFGHDRQRYPLEKILDMAQVAAAREDGNVNLLRAGLRDADSGVRYWAAQGLLIRGGAAVTAAREDLQAALQDESPTVRIIAARALGQYGSPADLKAALAVLEATASPEKNGAYASILTLNAVDALGEKAAPLTALLRDLPPQDPAAPGRANGYVSRLLEKIVGVKPAKAAAKPKRNKAKKAA